MNVNLCWWCDSVAASSVIIFNELSWCHVHVTWLGKHICSHASVPDYQYRRLESGDQYVFKI